MILIGEKKVENSSVQVIFNQESKQESHNGKNKTDSKKAQSGGTNQQSRRDGTREGPNVPAPKPEEDREERLEKRWKGRGT